MLPTFGTVTLTPADIFSYVEKGILVIGSTVVAVLILAFLWHAVMYVFFKGEDTERAHAKREMITNSFRIVWVMIIWWLVESVARSLGL